MDRVAVVAAVVIIVVIGNFVASGPIGIGRAAKFERQWRHYEKLRAADRDFPSPRWNDLDFERVIETNRPENTRQFVEALFSGFDRLDSFAQGDALLIKGRVLHDPSRTCESAAYFERSLRDAPDDFARAVLHETLFAIGRECHMPRPDHLARAIDLWRAMGVAWRADYEAQILEGKPITARVQPLEYQSMLPARSHAQRVLFGAQAIELAPTMLLAAQAERVSRDWLGQRLAAPWNVDAGIHYFEGEVVNTVAAVRAARTAILYGTFVKKLGSHWYAPDENGGFRFLVLRDKVEEYPTTRFLSDDAAVLIDSHGVSALVALALAKHADVVVGCCDYFDKIFAAEYLSQRGIHVVCSADRFLGYAIGRRGSGEIIGGGLLHARDRGWVLGGQPVSMDLHEPIVIEDTDEPYPGQYYDTAARYFFLLARSARLAFNTTVVDRREGLERLLQIARERHARIVAVRVWTEDEYIALRGWLDEDAAHRALLFHSAPNSPGRRILEEYASRVTVPDADPIFEFGALAPVFVGQ